MLPMQPAKIPTNGSSSDSPPRSAGSNSVASSPISARASTSGKGAYFTMIPDEVFDGYHDFRNELNFTAILLKRPEIHTSFVIVKAVRIEEDDPLFKKIREMKGEPGTERHLYARKIVEPECLKDRLMEINQWKRCEGPSGFLVEGKSPLTPERVPQWPMSVEPLSKPPGLKKDKAQRASTRPRSLILLTPEKYVQFYLQFFPKVNSYTLCKNESFWSNGEGEIHHPLLSWIKTAPELDRVEIENLKAAQEKLEKQRLTVLNMKVRILKKQPSDMDIQFWFKELIFQNTVEPPENKYNEIEIKEIKQKIKNIKDGKYQDYIPELIKFLDQKINEKKAFEEEEKAILQAMNAKGEKDEIVPLRIGFTKEEEEAFRQNMDDLFETENEKSKEQLNTLRGEFLAVKLFVKCSEDYKIDPSLEELQQIRGRFFKNNPSAEDLEFWVGILENYLLLQERYCPKPLKPQEKLKLQEMQVKRDNISKSNFEPYFSQMLDLLEIKLKFLDDLIKEKSNCITIKEKQLLTKNKILYNSKKIDFNSPFAMRGEQLTLEEWKNGNLKTYLGDKLIGAHFQYVKITKPKVLKDLIFPKGDLAICDASPGKISRRIFLQSAYTAEELRKT